MNASAILGIAGNILGFITFLVPARTFIGIWRAREAHRSQALPIPTPLPYMTALMSAMLVLYYGILQWKLILIGINAYVLVLGSLYLIIYVICAPVNIRNRTLMGLILLEHVFAVLFFVTWYAFKGNQRVTAVGWICAIVNVIVFASPLSNVRKVIIGTLRVQDMPLGLSAMYTVSSILWFFYGLLEKDYFILTPNVVGILCGIAQLILYFRYRNRPIPPPPNNNVVDLQGIQIVYD